MPDDRSYWFPAKRYGWGWGFPTRWQGWAVIASYVVLIGAGLVVIRPSIRPASFLAYLILLTIVLIAVCWLKGEPPRWHRGRRNGA